MIFFYWILATGYWLPPLFMCNPDYVDARNVGLSGLSRIAGLDGLG